jgi:hypothetical protein
MNALAIRLSNTRVDIPFASTRFFAPFDGRADSITDHSVNKSILYDGALDAYAELALWRLRGTRAMVTLIDSTTQYFVAGVVRRDSAINEITIDHNWFGCSTVQTPGGLCEVCNLTYVQ